MLRRICLSACVSACMYLMIGGLDLFLVTKGVGVCRAVTDFTKLGKDGDECLYSDVE